MTTTLVLLIAAACMSAGQAPGPDEDIEHPAWTPEMGDLFRQMGDWEDQAPIFSEALESMWTRNGWDSEADTAALEFSRSLTRIPPWNFKARLDHLTNAVQERYTLTPDQTRNFQRMVFREGWTLGFKYGPVMVKHAKGLLETRAKGEPFTAEQIAEFERGLDPHIDEMVTDFDRFIDTFEKELTPEQRRILQRDRASYDKRKSYFLDARKGWMDGKWTPEDWGLENDPVHAEALRKQRQAQVVIDADLTGARTFDETTWHRYVRMFIELYELDSSQQQSCRAILSDMLARAEAYRTPRRDIIDKIPNVYQLTAPELEPIRRMFGELQARVAAIPTGEQVQSARIRRPEAFRTPRSKIARPRRPKGTSALRAELNAA